MSLLAALGFTLFGAFAGVLVTVRVWKHIVSNPVHARAFLAGVASKLAAQTNDDADHECRMCGRPLTPAPPAATEAP